jgi:hypothetical protein
MHSRYDHDDDNCMFPVQLTHPLGSGEVRGEPLVVSCAVSYLLRIPLKRRNNEDMPNALQCMHLIVCLAASEEQ